MNSEESDMKAIERWYLQYQICTCSHFLCIAVILCLNDNLLVFTHLDITKNYIIMNYMPNARKQCRTN